MARISPKIKELILEGQNRYFDNEICQNMTISDSDIDNLCKSMKETAMKNTWQDSEKANIKDVTKNTLISWGVLKEVEGEIYPTNAFALLTRKMPQMPVIQCGVFKGKNRAHFVDRREFEGSIQEQMDAAYQYVLEKINMGMTIKGMYRQDVYELPTDSIRELIANAVAHRSYLEPGNIQVALFDDRLEVTSPGMLLNNVTISKMMEGYSKPRNPAIARTFAYMKIIEKWGTGIPRLFEACEEYGLPKPKLIDFDGDFRVNMYRKAETSVENTTKAESRNVPQNVPQDVPQDVPQNVPQDVPQNVPQDVPRNVPQDVPRNQLDVQILEAVKKDNKISTDKLAIMLGTSSKTIKRHIKKMDNISYVGRGANGHWEIK